MDGGRGTAGCALNVVVRYLLARMGGGAVPVFLPAAALHLFSTTSMGIFMATLARSMPQFGLLLILTMLSGGATPRESMPELVQNLMLAAPTMRFVELRQAVLYRGASLDVVWPQLLALLIIGPMLFMLALSRFQRTISQMA